MWLRMLPVLAAIWLMTGIAHAQAPPPSFFAGRSNDELRVLASDPHNDVLLRRSAATKLVITLADEGHFDDADAAAREFAKNIDPAAAKHAQGVRRRSRVHLIALGTLGVTLGVVFLSLVAAHRALAEALRAVGRIARLVTVFLLYAGLMGGYLASSYENGNPLPFLLFAGFMLPLVVVFRMWSAVSSPRLGARVGRGLAAVFAMAVAFLVVEHVRPGVSGGVGF